MHRRGLRWAAAGVAVYLAAVIAYIQLTEPEPQAAAKAKVAAPPAVNFTRGFPGPDRVWVRQAVAHARPEAQTLIRKVASRTFIEAGYDAGGGWAGLSSELTPDYYALRLNLDALHRHPQYVRVAVVLHEFGHMVDYGLISDGLRRRMVSGIAGEVPAAEKFADTFAKWALRVDAIPGGYDVPIPRSESIEEWGAPLAEIAARPEAREGRPEPARRA